MRKIIPGKLRSLHPVSEILIEVIFIVFNLHGRYVFNVASDCIKIYGDAGF